MFGGLVAGTRAVWFAARLVYFLFVFIFFFPRPGTPEAMFSRQNILIGRLERGKEIVAEQRFQSPPQTGCPAAAERPQRGPGEVMPDLTDASVARDMQRAVGRVSRFVGS